VLDGYPPLILLIFPWKQGVTAKGGESWMITVDTLIGVFGLCGTFFSLGLALGLFLGNTKK
jgi:hypothetical protein